MLVCYFFGFFLLVGLCSRDQVKRLFERHLQFNNYWNWLLSNLGWEWAEKSFILKPEPKSVACRPVSSSRSIATSVSKRRRQRKCPTPIGINNRLFVGIHQFDLFPNITSSRRRRWWHGHSTSAFPFNAKRCCSCRVSTTKGSMVAKDSG